VIPLYTPGMPRALLLSENKSLPGVRGTQAGPDADGTSVLQEASPSILLGTPSRNTTLVPEMRGQDSKRAPLEKVCLLGLRVTTGIGRGAQHRQGGSRRQGAGVRSQGGWPGGDIGAVMRGQPIIGVDTT